MSYIGSGAIGGIVGYYVGVQELLGIQSEEAVQDPETATESTPESEITPDNQSGNTFSYDFDNGVEGWTFGKRRDKQASEGRGSWSEQHGGSLEFAVNGAPNNIMAWKEVGPLTEGTIVTADYVFSDGYPHGATGQHLAAVLPGNEEDGEIVVRHKNPTSTDQSGTFQIEIPRDLPRQTQVELKHVIWPGEATMWIQNVEATPPE